MKSIEPTWKRQSMRRFVYLTSLIPQRLWILKWKGEKIYEKTVPAWGAFFHTSIRFILGSPPTPPQPLLMTQWVNRKIPACQVNINLSPKVWNPWQGGLCQVWCLCATVLDHRWFMAFVHTVFFSHSADLFLRPEAIPVLAMMNPTVHAKNAKCISMKQIHHELQYSHTLVASLILNKKY